jgi:IMP dehydrogenase
MFYQDEPGLTYDDVLLIPNYSEILPHEALLSGQFSKNITLNIPIVSSAMDTVTEHRTAITMAQEGGLGVIHKNLSIVKQAKEVTKVKKYESGMIIDPITVKKDQNLDDVYALVDKFKFSGFPVVDELGSLLGIITNRDIRYAQDNTAKVSELMTSIEKLVTAPEGTTLEEAKKILHKNRIEKLPVVAEDGKLVGLITIKDIEKSIAYPNANKDKYGRLRCAAAIGVGDLEYDRAKALVEAGVDAIIIDTAHGHSKGVMDMVKKVKALSTEVDVVAGNVATSGACEALIEAGADGIKVGNWTRFNLYNTSDCRDWCTSITSSSRLQGCLSC